jgi:glycosyltransferase involved in cell wall biosynthesis
MKNGDWQGENEQTSKHSPNCSTRLHMTHHIAHILPFPSVGGVEIAALRLMEGLEGDHFHNTAFCLRGAESVARLCAASGFEAVDYEAIEPSYRHPSAFLRNAFRLAREFRRRSVNLVHCQEVLAAYHAAVAGRLAGVPVVCHVRSQRPDISRRDASFLLAVNRFVFVSRNARECFGARVGAAHGEVIHDGFDVVEVDAAEARRDVRREFGFSADAKIVGMVARIARQKDYETLVRAAARVVAVEPRARFLVVGDYLGQSDYRDHYREVQAMVAEAGLTAHFVFTGHREDVVRLLAAMDVSVLCTHTEGLALAVLEAMAQGVPVVATAVGGVPELIVEGETGLLHAHLDDEELAGKIMAIFNDSALAARLSAAGRRQCATTFNRRRTLTATADLYHEMITGRSSADSGKAEDTDRAFAGGRRSVAEVTEGGD